MDRLCFSPTTVRFVSANHLRRELNRAWRAIQRLELDRAMLIASRLEFACEETEESNSESLWGEWQVLRAAALALSDNAAAALSVVSRCLKCPLSPALYDLAQTICRVGYWSSGERKAFDRISRKKLAQTVASRAVVVSAFDLCIDAAVQLQSLRLGRAKSMAAGAANIASGVVGKGSTPTLIALALRAQILYEEGDADCSGNLLWELMKNPITLIPIESLVRAYPLLARMHANRGDYPRAIQQLMEGEKLGEDRDAARLISTCLREQIFWLLADGRLLDARECLNRLARISRQQTVEAYGRRSPMNDDLALAGAWFEIACDRSGVAIDIIRQLQREATLQGDLYFALRLGVCLVEALESIGLRLEATGELLQLLRTGMTAGLCQSFIDSGPGVRTLILDMHRNGCDGGEALTCFLDVLANRLACCIQVGLQLGCIVQLEKVLTPREKHVLRLIGSGLSNKRIARDLQITPETVKTHAKHIFEKLGTRTRAEAITRAVKLCIL